MIRDSSGTHPMLLKKIICRSGLALLALVFVISFSQRKISAQEAEVRVAAAADLQFAMADLGQQYKNQSGNIVNVTYGSSGNFFSQILNGAPFDLFFSADVDYPRQLVIATLANPATFYKYALGRIVIWVPPGSKIDIAQQKWNALLDPSVQKIAIANPEHAPYGRAAVAAMHKAGVYEKVKAKLVLGENISQAAQFVQSGNAQIGIVALSLALSPAMKSGERWEIPADAHPPIEQGAILLSDAKNKDAARAFLEFVKSESAVATLAKYGFALPGGATPRP
jgi:molybdate transport system substrate-binding protein